MKRRTKVYFERRKALDQLCHPGDLKSFLLAELRTARSLVVKKDVMQMLFALEQKEQPVASTEA